MPDTAARPWEPSYETYDSTIDGKTIAIIVDLEAFARVPVASNPKLLRVRASMISPSSNGQVSREESGVLFALEDALVSHVEGQGGFFVGRSTLSGVILFAFYVGDTVTQPLLNLEKVGPYELQWQLKDDPHWGFYLEGLYPDLYARSRIANRHLLRARREGGDRLEAVRRVDHRTFFSALEPAQKAGNALRALGYQVDAPDPCVQENGRWLLEFHRDDRLDSREPDAFVRDIIDIIHPLGGEYDGWGAVIVEDST